MKAEKIYIFERHRQGLAGSAAGVAEIVRYHWPRWRVSYDWSGRRVMSCDWSRWRSIQLSLGAVLAGDVGGEAVLVLEAVAAG
jgi:hypothetical protein